VIDFHGQRFGDKQESKLLEFNDWIEIYLRDPVNNADISKDYTLHLADGTEQRGTLDSNGYAKIDNIPPGKIKIEFPNVDEDVNSED